MTLFFCCGTKQLNYDKTPTTYFSGNLEYILVVSKSLIIFNEYVLLKSVFFTYRKKRMKIKPLHGSSTWELIKMKLLKWEKIN